MMVAHMKYMSLQPSQSSCAVAYSRLEGSLTVLVTADLGCALRYATLQLSGCSHQA